MTKATHTYQTLEFHSANLAVVTVTLGAHTLFCFSRVPPPQQVTLALTPLRKIILSPSATRQQK